MREFIEELWEVRDTLNKESLKDPAIKKAILDVIDAIDSGNIRIAHKKHSVWIVNEWIKKAIILFDIAKKYFLQTEGIRRYYDNIPLKFENWDDNKFENLNSQIMVGAIIKKGVFIGKNNIIMPSFIDIGTYIDSNTKIKSFTHIGKGTQIGKNCYIGTHVGIEGALYPLDTLPTIIEDNVHISAKCQIGQGVIISEGSILDNGCFINKHTKIYDEEVEAEYIGEIPPYSVVVPSMVDGKLNCIVKKTLSKEERTSKSVNQILKEVI